MTSVMTGWFKKTKNKFIKHRRYVLFRSFYNSFLKGRYKEKTEKVFIVRGKEWLLDVETSTFFKEFADAFQYIEQSLDALSPKKQHVLKQIRDVHLFGLFYSYFLFSEKEQEENEATFTDSLHIIKEELEELKADVYSCNQSGFHASIQAIKQREFVKR